MKILGIAPTPFFADRGCHMRILGEIQALQRRGHEVLLLTYHLGRDIEGVPTRRTKNVGWYDKLEAGPAMGKFYLDWLLLRETIKAIGAFRPDVIHGHLHEGAFIGLLARKLTGRKLPVVFDVQGSLTRELDSYGWLNKMPLVRPLFWAVEKWITRGSEQCVGSNVDVGEFLRSTMGLPDSRVHTIIDGVHMGFFDGAKGRDLRAELGIAPQRPIVLYTGALLASKGTDNYFNAIPEVLAGAPEAFFLVVGYPVEHSQALVQRLGVAEHVKFMGQVDYFELPDYLAIGDVAVDPKEDVAGEASGKIINYMGGGLPVACFDNANNRAFLGDTGSLATEKTPSGLAKAILALLADPAACKAKGQAARQRVAELFTWEAGGRRYEEVFQAALAQMGGR
ncbi:glycosyl transferase group 1 [Desulfarculus baarsii DSM 2075]|uniref:Glycosyl transferase group 1 n=1 Tax=Desulfarculus baarsii (strain ATCC 33931 / DSM 2075 / LMG 7858 / VKM B-1802 / 2st14) TaxID=644282 RepID=E1QEK2_DESB2|nr:glycosyltransferase [Desulfarculus baarsii]ADK83988.1 glycosyl transferase group 1 [Desulfarculus baarsii DSM 2075]